MGFLNFLFGPLSSEEFGERFVREMRRAGVTDRLVYDPVTDRILRGSTENPYTINLSNFYREYLTLPRWQRARHLIARARLVANWNNELPDDFEEARSHLRPKIWARAGIEKSRLQRQVDTGEPDRLDLPEFEIGSHLIASLAYDFPQSMTSVSNEQLEKWGITFYEALEIARENLEQTQFAVAEIGSGRYASMTGDSYDACRLLLPGLIERFKVQGELIAIVPSRDVLLVCGTEDEQGLGIMTGLVEKTSAEHPRLLVPIPIRLDADAWVDWLPPRDHPLSEKFRDFARHYLLREFGEQQGLLDRLHEIDGTDIFVASYILVRKKEDNRLFSYAVWSEGVDTLLPKTEWIYFLRERDILAIATWERAELIVGHLMEPTDHYPPRVRVRAFPSEKEIASLGNGTP